MNPKRDSKRLKHKSQQKFQSPLPKKLAPFNEPNDLNLRDLSPFRPLYGSCHTNHAIHFSHTGMELIQTPANTFPRRSYLDQIDESLKPISGVINFEDDHASSSNSEDDMAEVTDSDAESSQPSDIQMPEEEKASTGQEQELVQKPIEPTKPSSPKKPKEVKKQSSSVNKTPNQKRQYCNCKKTKCLKLYCDCFRDNQVCGQGCNCVGCHNLQTYEEERNNAMLTLMDRNPEAFKPKIELEQHSKGCHCKKSNCQKKYCECFQAGLKCGSNCKCQDCKNGQDRKCEKHQDYGNIDIRKTTAKKERRVIEWHPAV